jgi:class 3 adenylate cyclase/tetratricopeptide (TPR) repeat protein
MSQPVSTITIMFTDLVGSTALANRVGDEASQALRRAHERILTREFERFDGEVIKGTGDGYMVAFASARQAVECGVSVQIAIDDEHVEGRYADLSVRIGLHTGEPVRDHDDLFGKDVNLASRIEAEAQGGQVLVSEITWLLTRYLPDLTFAAIGLRSLKGFDEPVPLFAVHGQHDHLGKHRTRFVGRSRETAELRRHVGRALNGHGSVVFVSGDAGVGKTRLVSEIAIESGDRGMRVLSGSAYEAQGMPPYLPVVDALKQYFADRSRTAIPLPSDTDPVLARLLPELQTSADDRVRRPTLHPESAPDHLFEDINQLLRRIGQDQAIMLFLDDLQWADRSTLLLVRHIGQHIGDARMLIVGTYRDVEVDDQHVLSGIVADLIRRQVAERIVLRPFDRVDAAALVEAALGAPPAPHVVDALFAAAEGNSFFTEEPVHQLRDQGRDLSDDHAAVGDWAIPDGVRLLISRRLAHLSEGAQQLLAYSSVIGRDLSVATVTTVAGGDEVSVLGQLDEALAAGLLREGDAGYAFSHALVRDTLYRQLSPGQRQRLHERVGEALESVYAATIDTHLAELAHHFCGASSENVKKKAVDYSRRAGDQAFELLAYDEAARHYERALQAREEGGSPNASAPVVDMQIALGESLYRSGASHAAVDAFRRAACGARELRSSERLARAVVGFDGAAGDTGEPALAMEAARLLDETLQALGEHDSPSRVLTLSRRAWSRSSQASTGTRLNQGESLTYAREAVAMAERLGDAKLQFQALYALRGALWGPGKIGDRAAVASELVMLATQIGDARQEFGGRLWSLADSLELGDIARADAECEEIARIAQDLKEPLASWYPPAQRAMRALFDGRFDQAEKFIFEASAAGERAGAGWAKTNRQIQLYVLYRDIGRLGDVASATQEVAEQHPEVPLYRAFLALLYADLQRDDDARREFESLATANFSNVPRDENWIATVALGGELSAHFGDTARVATLYEQLLPHHGLNVTVDGFVVALGAVQRTLGQLATALGRFDEATRHFDDALAMNSKMGARPWLARTQLDYAKMLLLTGNAQLLPQSHRITAQALTIARDLGMQPLAESCRQLGTTPP